MLRGEIYLATLDPIAGSEQGGTRPVLIVSRNALNANAPIVIIAPLTRRENKKRLYPTHVVLLRSDTGLGKDSVALCEQLRAIAKTRLIKRLGALAPASMQSVNETLRITLDL